MTIYILEQSTYEDSSIIDVFTDKAVAEATAEVYRAADRGDYTYSVGEYEPQTAVPHVVTWWEANAWRSTEDPPTVHTWQRTEVSYGPPPEPHVTVTNGRMQKANPGYVKGTPFASRPDTPGGRYRTVPSRSVHVIEATEELAVARALTALGTDELS